jgi:serine/threonine protein kinase
MVESSEPLLLNSRFKLDKCVIRNDHNAIWRALDLKTNQFVAVKQIIRVSYTALIEEKVLKTMMGTEGFPAFYGTSSQDSSYFLIMQLFDKDLQQIFQSHTKKFTAESVLKLGLHMIDRIRSLHARGYLHRDIKPAQFMLAKGSDVLYLIDFNLSSKVPVLESTASSLSSSYVGNATFASIAAHSSRQQNKRDDCESVIYVIIYFLRGSLPWQKLPYKDSTHMWAMIKTFKANTPIEQLCEGLPDEVRVCLSYCRGLRFMDTPNYEYLKRLLTSAYALLAEDAISSQLTRVLEANSIAASQQYYNITKTVTTINRADSKRVTLRDIEKRLSQTVGTEGAQMKKVKKRRYPRILDRSILQKAADFARRLFDDC